MADDSVEKKPLPADELLHRLFENASYSPVSDQVHGYPEGLLQLSNKGVKLYNSLQSFHKQFILDTDPTSIIRWTNSSMRTAERLVVESWMSSDHEVNLAEIKPEPGNARRPHSIAKGLNTLFSWSTGDDYVRRERVTAKRDGKGKQKEDGEKKEENGVKRDEGSKEDVIRQKLTTQLNLQDNRGSATNKLNRIVEQESNKFIYDRIKVIKDHHTMKITQMIHERKRKDHQLRLRRLQEKEEEYERALRAAVTEQGQVRYGGFLGSIFGYSGASASHNHHQFTRSPTQSRSHSRSSRSSSETVADSAVSSSSSSRGAKKRFSFLPWAAKSEKNEMVLDIDQERAGADHEQKEEEKKEEEQTEDDNEREEDEDEFENFEAAPPESEPETKSKTKPEKKPETNPLDSPPSNVHTPLPILNPTDRSQIPILTPTDRSQPSILSPQNRGQTPVLSPQIRGQPPILSPQIRGQSGTQKNTIHSNTEPVIFGFDELDHFKVSTSKNDLDHRFLPVQTTNSDKIIDLGPSNSANDENLLNL